MKEKFREIYLLIWYYIANRKSWTKKKLNEKLFLNILKKIHWKFLILLFV